MAPFGQTAAAHTTYYVVLLISLTWHTSTIASTLTRESAPLSPRESSAPKSGSRGHKGSKQASITTPPSMGYVARTVTLELITYTNAGGISEYLLFAPLVRRPGAPRLAAQQRPQITCRTRSLSGEICMSM